MHASWANTQATNITLLEAAYHDISESIRLEQQLKVFSEGIYKGGTGPSAVHRKEQHYSAQMKRADQYAAELLSHQSSLYSTTRQSAQADFEVHVDPQCSQSIDMKNKLLSTMSRLAESHRVLAHSQRSQMFVNISYG